ncbi:MAG: hypothetical protein GY869_32285, partial [Planctomycetes bacterium]|nr:hypothetical protein [Planctomycetota bacterium]
SDGKTLAWGKDDVGSSNAQREPFEYSISLPAKAEALDSSLGTPRKLAGSDKRFSRAQDKWRDWTLNTRKGGNYGYQAVLEIHQQNNIKASIERDSTDGYRHRSYTFTPDGQRIISGGSHGVLTAYNRAGDKLGDFVGHTSDVWAVAVSPAGDLLASGSDDQTVRLWNIATRELLLTIFHGNNNEWVAWTPTGHYTSSPNGDQMVGWHINRGHDQAADYLKASQLREHFYRPDIVANAIQLRDVNLAIAQAGGSTFSLEQLNTELAPKFSITKPLINPYITHKRQIEISLSFTTQPASIRAYVNGGLMDNIKNIKKWVMPTANRHIRKLTLPLTRGDNDIRIIAKSKNKIDSEPQQLLVKFKSRYQEQQGTLYLIAVGVSKYADQDRSLRFAATDARAIHQLLTQQQGHHYQTVTSKLLEDQAATAANIKAALQLFAQAGRNDTVVLFLSGHGDNAGGEYYFLPHDAQEQDDNWQPDTVVKWRELQYTLENTLGKRIFLVDTCYAGGAFNSRLIKDSSDHNIVVISATDELSVAQELTELGHGIFTHALLKGLQGDADLMDRAEKVITIKELDTYLSFAINQISDGNQIPMTTGFKDFGFVKVF